MWQRDELPCDSCVELSKPATIEFGVRMSAKEFLTKGREGPGCLEEMLRLHMKSGGLQSRGTFWGLFPATPSARPKGYGALVPKGIRRRKWVREGDDPINCGHPHPRRTIIGRVSALSMTQPCFANLRCCGSSALHHCAKTSLAASKMTPHDLPPFLQLLPSDCSMSPRWSGTMTLCSGDNGRPLHEGAACIYMFPTFRGGLSLPLMHVSHENMFRLSTILTHITRCRAADGAQSNNPLM